MKICFGLAWAVLFLLVSCASDEDTVTGPGDFEQLVASFESRAEVERSDREELVLQCMITQGIELDEARAALGGPTPTEPSEGSLDFLTSGLEDEQEIAEAIGFGFAPVAVFQRDHFDAAGDSPSAGDPPPVSVNAEQTLTACNRDVIGTDYHPPALMELADVVADIEARVQIHPDVAAAYTRWSSCMADQGAVDLESPEQLVAATQVAFEAMLARYPLPIEIAAVGMSPNAFERARSIALDVYGTARTWDNLAKLEITAALQDLECRSDARVQATENDVRNLLVQQQMDGR